MNEVNFRIYGDNILECEKTLKYILKSTYKKYDSSNFKKYKIDSPSYSPAYKIKIEKKNCIFTLYPAYYDRWSSNIMDLLRLKGATLKEGPDSIVTKIIDFNKEKIIFGTEYCGALPAGNNAWQRLGRALAFAEAKIPFLYYSEIGGMELDSKTRVSKSGRLPNPLVPYSLISANLNYPDAVILPIYAPSPTITSENNQKYKNIFSEEESLDFIYSLLTEDSSLREESTKNIRNKGIEFIRLLIENRKIKDILSFDELIELSKRILKNNTNLFLQEKQRKWKKTISIDVLKTVETLLEFAKTNCISMGADNFAFCQIPISKKEEFIRLLEKSYPSKKQVIEKIKYEKKPLALCWIAGFKPKGEDSRPDRGLLPLFKMIYGNEYSVISIVFGPIKEKFIENLGESICSLPENNGLWRAIFTQSDFIIVDSFIVPKEKDSSLKKNIKDILDVRTYKDRKIIINYSPCQGPPNFGEDDVDNVVHGIFSCEVNPNLIFESLCNPPGGDWSGIEIFYENKIFRWSSLPRVTQKAKRPDHIIQFGKEFLIIESKFSKNNLEENVGDNLKSYVKTLFESIPNSVRNFNNEKWIQNKNKISTYDFKYLSAVAYYSNIDIFDDSNEVDEDISEIFIKTKCDIILKVHFKKDGKVFLRWYCKNQNIQNWFEKKESLLLMESI